MFGWLRVMYRASTEAYHGEQQPLPHAADVAAGIAVAGVLDIAARGSTLQPDGGLTVVPGSLSIDETAAAFRGRLGNVAGGRGVSVGPEPSAAVTYDVRLATAGT